MHQGAQYDNLGQASNFLPDRWSHGAAPVLYVPGCANGVYPCTGNNRQAMNPSTGQFLGVNTHGAFGTLVPNSGNALNGIFLQGEGGLPKATYSAPALAIRAALRDGLRPHGPAALVLRGGAGMFFDRPYSSAVLRRREQPAHVRHHHRAVPNLQTLGSGGLTTEGAPGLNAFPEEIELPTSIQWNGGAQMALPWAMALDASYVGQHAYNLFNGVNINAIDFGAVFLPESRIARRRPRRWGRTRSRRTTCARSAATGASRSSRTAAGGPTTRSSCRSTAGSGTGCRSASST